METVTIKKTRTNEKVEVLEDVKGVKVKLDFFWNSHGKRINWNHNVTEQKNYSSADVRLERYSFTENYEYSGSHDFETIRLFINGKQIAGDVWYAKGTLDDNDEVCSMRFKLDCGWG